MVDAVTNTFPASTPVTASSEQGTSLASDFDTFLQMLTAQAKYQDPLEPLDSAEYASQLAQFSSVEQGVLTNELLEQVVAQLGSHDLTSLASWIGKDVRNTAAVFFSGSPLTLSFDPVDGATDAELIAYDENGAEVDRMEIDPDAGTVQWYGMTSSGTQLPDGLYSFRLEHYAETKRIGASPVYNYARITELTRLDGETRLSLENGGSVTLDDVLAVRAPVQE